MKTIRNIFICVFCFATLVSTGFGLWFFNADSVPSATINSSEITVESDGSAEIGSVEFVSPLELGFEGYGISIASDFENMSDLQGGITFAPKIKFNFADFQLISVSQTAYYYFTFESESSFFAETEASAGYLMFDLTQAGHGESNKIELAIRDEEDNLIQKKNALGEPILDEDLNPIYEVSVEFTPVFKFKTGCKPADTSEYKALINALASATGDSTINLHIVLE